MSKPARRDLRGIVGCAIALVIGVAAIAASGDFSALGSVFPRTIAALMIVPTVLYNGPAWRNARTAAAEVPGLLQESTPRRLGVAAVMLAWSFLIVPLGFLFTSFCARIALRLLAQHGRWTACGSLVCGASTALALLALYSLFRFVLQVPLPVGVFW